MPGHSLGTAQRGGVTPGCLGVLNSSPKHAVTKVQRARSGEQLLPFHRFISHQNPPQSSGPCQEGSLREEPVYGSKHSPEAAEGDKRCPESLRSAAQQSCAVHELIHTANSGLARSAFGTARTQSGTGTGTGTAAWGQRLGDSGTAPGQGQRLGDSGSGTAPGTGTAAWGQRQGRREARAMDGLCAPSPSPLGALRGQQNREIPG